MVDSTCVVAARTSDLIRMRCIVVVRALLLSGKWRASWKFRGLESGTTCCASTRTDVSLTHGRDGGR